MKSIVWVIMSIVWFSTVSQAQVPWVVSIDLGNPNLEYGLSQKLVESPGGWTRVVTLGGETGRAMLPENPSGHPAEGIFLDVEPSFAEAVRGKSLWLLIEAFSDSPEEIRVIHNRLGNRREDAFASGIQTLSTLPVPARAQKKRWGFLLFRCADVRLGNGLKGASDLQIVLPDDHTVINRVLAMRIGPETAIPDTG